jgi:hypothetical protein
LNNLAILLNCGSKYFFLRAPLDADNARDCVMAISVDTNRPACLINLEAPVPRYFDPTCVGGAVAAAEGIWREEIRRQVQMVLQLCPLQIQIPPPEQGLVE